VNGGVGLRSTLDLPNWKESMRTGGEPKVDRLTTAGQRQDGCRVRPRRRL